MRAGLVVDLFAGAGGASVGIEAALDRPVDVAINHDPVALAVHRANHPDTRHLEADVWEVKPQQATNGRSVDLLWASPDCTHFSVAKGGQPRQQNIRSLAWVVTRWAKAVHPRVICLENVAEFRGWGPLDSDGKPIRMRKGETFRRWRKRLESYGYTVDYRILDASEYGAPTKRRRLFLVARRDGEPIQWPEPTHGQQDGLFGRQPLHTAAECIDWSIPCRSIFERKKPLAEKTLWRIAQGIKRYVIDAAEPFIVKVNHGRMENRTESVHGPLSTVTAQQRGHALVVPTLIQSGYGEREGQAARVPGLDKPLGTIVAGGQKHALVAAFLTKHFSGVVGVPFDGRPLDTITATDHHALTAATLVQLRGERGQGADLNQPMPTVTAQGLHIAEVRAFLVSYFGSPADLGQSLHDPLRTITTRDRFGLVMVQGQPYEIADIGMRMLEPHELLAAQFGRFAASYDLSAATTKKAKVRLIGNSVCPEAAEALVRANVRERVRVGAAGVTSVLNAVISVLADTDDIQSRLPAALVGGRMVATAQVTGLDAAAIQAIATEVLERASSVEPGLSMVEALRLVLSYCAGLTDGFLGNSPAFKSADLVGNQVQGTKTRIAGVINGAGERTGATVDVSPV